MSKLTNFSKTVNGEWWQFVPLEEAAKAYQKNIDVAKAAVEEYCRRPRPLRILAIHGSSRSNHKLSCAHELSNSQLLLRSGLDKFRENSDLEIEEVNLREYNISPCNSCYSTSSALCGWVCDCFPFDEMQLLYPKVLRSDVLLISTGVNQTAMSSRLKLFSDRLISMDGGYARDHLELKDSEFRARAIQLSTTTKIVYEQRLQGRVCAFFIAAKDEKDTGGVDEDGRTIQSYIDVVAYSLYRGFYDYGCEFADGNDWYAGFASNPFEEMSFDKAVLHYDREAQDRAMLVIQRAIEKARYIMTFGPRPRKHPINRT